MADDEIIKDRLLTKTGFMPKMRKYCLCLTCFQTCSHAR